MYAATRKLLCGDTFDANNDDQVLAVFSNRMLVELAIAESEIPTRLAINGVRNHMRTLLGIAGRSAIASRALSEPALAIAAVHALCQDVKSYTTGLKKFISKFILEGVVIDSGAEGGLVSRMLWIMARDAVYMDEGTMSSSGYCSVSAPAPAPAFTSTSSSTSSSSSLSTSQPMVIPVTLRSILEKLLGDEMTQPASKTGGHLCIYAEEVYVNFTHFVKMTESISILTADLLYSLWCRGAAVQCAQGQHVFDGFFVTYRGDLKEPFDAKNLSYVVWRTQARLCGMNCILDEELTGPVIEDVGCGSDSESRTSWKPEHVTIIMDLCNTEKFEENERYCKISHYRAVSKQPTSGGWTGYIGTDEPDRYCINIRGVNQYEMLRSTYEEVESEMEFVMRRRIVAEGPFSKYALKFYEQMGDMDVVGR